MSHDEVPPLALRAERSCCFTEAGKQENGAASGCGSWPPSAPSGSMELSSVSRQLRSPSTPTEGKAVSQPSETHNEPLAPPEVSIPRDTPLPPTCYTSPPPADGAKGDSDS